MSYLEMLWIIGLFIFPIILSLFVGFVVDCTEMIGESMVIGIVLWVFAVGGISTAISEGINDYVVTSEFETIPKFVELTPNNLTIMSDDNKIFTYKNYRDIRRLSEGGKFYKVYKYKKCFGPDSNTFDIIIK